MDRYVQVPFMHKKFIYLLASLFLLIVALFSINVSSFFLEKLDLFVHLSLPFCYLLCLSVLKTLRSLHYVQRMKNLSPMPLRQL